MPLLYIKT